MSLETVYSAVAARRLQWDNLVWQVPVLSLTAQAFLFTIAIGGGSSQTARVIASALSMGVSYLCITLMARHRQAEIHDAHWLEKVESDNFGIDAVHGKEFRRQRNAGPVDGGWTDRFVPIVPGYKTWITGLMVLFIVALGVLLASIWWPGIFESSSSDG